jgi:hypothetical protein
MRLQSIIGIAELLWHKARRELVSAVQGAEQETAAILEKILLNRFYAFYVPKLFGYRIAVELWPLPAVTLMISIRMVHSPMYEMPVRLFGRCQQYAIGEASGF